MNTEMILPLHANVRSGRFRRMLGHSSFGVLLAVVIISPLVFGSVDPLWIAIWTFCLAVSLFLTAINGELPHWPWRALAPLALLIPAATIILTIQLWPIDSGSSADSGWIALRDLIDPSAAGTFSATRGIPAAASGAMIVFVLTLLRSYMIGQRPQGGRWMLLAIALSGLVWAVLSMVLFALHIPFDAVRESPVYRGSLTGPFINRNTAAAYWGLCVLIWSGLSIEAMTRHLNSAANWPGIRYLLRRQPSWPAMASAAAALVCFCAVAMTASRAGVLLTFGASLLMCLLWLRYKIAMRRKGMLAVAVVLVFGIVLMLGSGRIVQRIDRAGLSDDYRLETYASTIDMIRDHLWLGVGVGNFANVFPSYRRETLGVFGVWDHAHNTLLEIGAEMGVPFALMVLAAWLYWGWRLARGTRTSQQEIEPTMAVCLWLFASLHALIDFSLQIPGYAIPFAAVIGCVLGRLDRPCDMTLVSPANVSRSGQKRRRRSVKGQV